MNWQQRSGQIYANLMEPGLFHSCDSGSHIAKSSVHRFVRLSVAISIQNRPCGNTRYQWLHRLVWAVYVFESGHWQRDVVRILPYFAEGRIGVSNALQGTSANRAADSELPR